MRQLLPLPLDDVDPYEVYRPDESTTRWLRLNMIASLDGRATDPSGATAGLASEGDHEVFRTLRALSDCILVGAGTARAEGYGPHRLRADLRRRRQADGRRAPAPIVVVSRSLALDPETPLFAEATTPTIVVTCAAAPADRLEWLSATAPVVVAGEDHVDFHAALDELAERFGLPHVLCEGGPHLNGALFAAGVVDELCLTVAPLITGATAPTIVQPPVPSTGMRLQTLCEQDGELYARYQLGSRLPQHQPQA
jgi:riboflavin-specific deaminase-like protein